MLKAGKVPARIPREVIQRETLAPAKTRRGGSEGCGNHGKFAYKRIPVSFALMLLLGCAATDFRFERIDGTQPVALPLKLDGLYGLRDGAVVNVEGHFTNDNDVVTLNASLFLRPPAEFRSGTYLAIIGGKAMMGAVECPSLTFQGGQTALPAVGGVFVLKDEQGRPVYRIRIPATQLKRR